LGALALGYGSDKWGVLHRFTPHYDRHLRRLRADAVRVLEIGVGGYAFMPGGASLRMWKRYFHRGQIFGIDIFDKSVLDEPRITTLVADQNDPRQMHDLAERHGPFDVIIDDGSHVNRHVRTAFHALYPHLNPGGVYVIEDLWTAFCPGFGGQDTRHPGPGTSLHLVRDLVDSIQYEEHPDGPSAGPDSVAATTTGLHVYHNIAFIEKGVNAEGGVPRWVPRDFAALVDIDTPPTRWSTTE
ncbi:class I SAM-dependent methyltransferase, partial [Spirillospora sp. NPDC049652]